MRLYCFGNGNLSFEDFLRYYVIPIRHWVGCATCKDLVEFLLCDYRGVDTLVMEYLKMKTDNVTVFHVGRTPRYFPSRFHTKADAWVLHGGFKSDQERDEAAIQRCTHFLAFDINSDENHKSGTQCNIERCLELGKQRLGEDWTIRAECGRRGG